MRMIKRLTEEELQSMEFKQLHSVMSDVKKEYRRIVAEIEVRKKKERSKWNRGDK